MTNTARMLAALGAMLVGAVAACGSDSASSGGTGAGSGSGANGSGGNGSGGKGSGAGMHEDQCSADPIACPAGQTCWFNDAEGSDFQCFPSGPGKSGDDCDNFVGMPTCADDLICLHLAGDDCVMDADCNDAAKTCKDGKCTSAKGVCTPYCDGTHKCPAGVTCLMVQTPGMVTFSACEPPDATPDAGADGG